MNHSETKKLVVTTGVPSPNVYAERVSLVNEAGQPISNKTDAELNASFVPGANWSTAVVGNSWVAGPRSVVTTIPVAAFTPTKNNTVMALDVMPKGAPSTGPGGYAWIDVCDSDVFTNNNSTGVARVGIGSDRVRFSSVAYGKTPLPLRLSVTDAAGTGVEQTGFFDILDGAGNTAMAGYLRIHPVTPADYSAVLNVGTEAARVALTVRGAPSQSASLILAQNSAGTGIFAVTATGKVATSGITDPVNGTEVITVVGGSARSVTLTGGSLTGLNGNGVVGISNASTVPASNASGGGILYAEGGALKWRGSSGTITTLGVA